MKPFFQFLPFVLCLSLLAVSASAETVPLPSEYLDFIQSRGPDDPEYADLFPNEDTHADNQADHSDETEPETEPEVQPEPEKTQEPTFESQDSNIPETEAPAETQEPTEVTEASKDPEETISLQELVQSVHNTESACQYIAGFLLFFVVCALCYFSYKFFKIFF